LYLVRDKKTKRIIFSNPASLKEKLKNKAVYPHFDAKTMEVLKTDMKSLPQHYTVDTKGFLSPMSVEEMAAKGFLVFEEDLARYIEYSDENSLFPDDKYIRLVLLALKLNLIKTIQQCLEAFRMLDKEFEARVAQIYNPGLETKIMKDYIAWIDEGKPAGDKREIKYRSMKETIDSFKQEYKEVRAMIKEIIIPLKEQGT
jgi:hypothetical protein